LSRNEVKFGLQTLPRSSASLHVFGKTTLVFTDDELIELSSDKLPRRPTKQECACKIDVFDLASFSERRVADRSKVKQIGITHPGLGKHFELEFTRRHRRKSPGFPGFGKTL